jgi:hypothetical protein
MDPYLEPHWLDVHTKLVAYAADALNRVLPATLVARTEERVAIESEWEGSRAIGPDVRVFSPASADPRTSKSGAAVDAPFKLVVEVDPVIERFIRILDDSGRLVTVIEFSRWGKQDGPVGLPRFRLTLPEPCSRGLLGLRELAPAHRPAELRDGPGHRRRAAA